MQREILFKAKRISTGEWVYFGLFEKYPEYVINQDTICQYAGRTDKNGNKIFEGDRVLVQGTKKVGTYETYIIYHNCMFKLKENKTYLIDGVLLPNALEIIGNIHDKPQQP